MTHRRLLAATVLSGVFSYAGTLLLDLIPGGVALFRNSGVYLAGVLFGAIVMAPRAAGNRPELRRAAAIVLSTLIYYAAVKLAMYQSVTLHVREMAACALAGAVGALAVGGASALVLSLPLSSARFMKAALWGGLTGAIFGINGTFRLPGFSQGLMLIVGFTTWQTAVGFAFFRPND